MERSGEAGQAIQGNVILRRKKIRFVCRITKARTETRPRNISYLFLFHCNNGYAKAPQCYVVRTLSVSFLYFTHRFQCYVELMFVCFRLQPSNLTYVVRISMKEVRTGDKCWSSRATSSQVQNTLRKAVFFAFAYRTWVWGTIVNNIFTHPVTVASDATHRHIVQVFKPHSPEK